MTRAIVAAIALFVAQMTQNGEFSEHSLAPDAKHVVAMPLS
jgi:hypothetical protein